MTGRFSKQLRYNSSSISKSCATYDEVLSRSKQLNPNPRMHLNVFQAHIQLTNTTYVEYFSVPVCRCWCLNLHCRFAYR